MEVASHMRMVVLFAVLLVCLSTRQSLGKTARTLMTDEQLRQARANVANYDWAAKSLANTCKAVEWVLEMPDDELWDFIPPADQPRALNVRFGDGCPIHGKEIFKVGGHYPWIIDREHPFKVKCPIGGEVYPSNDFVPWSNSHKDKLDTHAKYVDDGSGWIDTERVQFSGNVHPLALSRPGLWAVSKGGRVSTALRYDLRSSGLLSASGVQSRKTEQRLDTDGNRYWFVAYYIFWQRWRRDILPVIPKLAYAYALTGDTRYSHKAAVMLARIASEYPEMDYAKQAYHNGAWPSGCAGKILDHDWEGDSTIEPLAVAYDEIYDGLDSDSALSTFLSGKGIDHPKDFIEANFLQEAAKAIETGVVHGNMNYQEQLAVVARVLDNSDPARGYTTDQMIEWITNGPGEMNTLFYNGVTRDGAASEESIGYTSIWTNSFLGLGERLKPLGYDLLSNPRLKKMVDFYIQTTVADRFSPCIGDAGGDMTGGAAPVLNRYIFGKAYDIWGDPLYAKVLNRVGWPNPEVSEKPEALEAAKEKAKSLGTDLGLKTRDLGGYGLAVLETGEGENRRAASIYYGSAGAWHGHFDRLNISMWSHGRCMLPEMGYPAHWGTQADLWTRGTPTHYCVQIDENRQAKKREGHLNLLASGPGVQVMDASGENAYAGVASLYRRTVAMVDISDEDSYLLDIFRVKGGKVHDYIFHGLPFGEFTMTGVDLGEPQAKGTLMGEDVEFGKTFNGMKTGGYQYLTSVRRGKPDREWSANWLLKDKDLGLKMTMLPGSARGVIVADGPAEPSPGNPDKMEYVLARNDTGASAFVSVIEPYKDKHSIRRVQPLKPDGDATRDDLAAVKVDVVGRRDYLFSALDPARATFDSGDIEFAGEFGAISEDDSGVISMFLVNGSVLRKGDCAIRIHREVLSSRKAGVSKGGADGVSGFERSGNPETPHAKVASVDYKANTITLDRAVPMPDAFVGQVVVISNPMHSASFTVKSVATKSERTVLGFGDISMIEGIGTLKSVDDAAKVVQSSNRLGGYGMKWEGKLIPGRALVNQSLTDSWLITNYDSGVWHVAASAPISGKINTTDGKPSRFFYVGEVNAGDDVMLPAIVSVRRDGKGGYEVRATAPYELSLPGRD